MLLLHNEMKLILITKKLQGGLFMNWAHLFNGPDTVGSYTNIVVRTVGYPVFSVQIRIRKFQISRLTIP